GIAREHHPKHRRAARRQPTVQRSGPAGQVARCRTDRLVEEHGACSNMAVPSWHPPRFSGDWTMLKEFKEFATRGNVLDMAVGIIIGAAFTTIVSSLVDDILMPPLGLILG